MSRYVCAKCGSDRASKHRTGQKCSCGGTFVPEGYRGSLQNFETGTPSLNEQLLQTASEESDIESLDRVVHEDEKDTLTSCPACGEKGELIGFESEAGDGWQYRVNGYECDCGAEWTTEMHAGDQLA